MKNLHDAIQDCKADELAGREIDFAEIAADYGLNAALLERKYRESYPNGAFELTSGDAKWDKERLEEKVLKLCKKYNVSREGCTERTVKNVKFTVIGRFRTRLLGVSHKDGQAYYLTGCV